MEIQKNIPLPDNSDRIQWPFKSMDVGDSVYVEDRLKKKATSYAHVYGFHSNKKFKSRKEGVGVRIWRIL